MAKKTLYIHGLNQPVRRQIVTADERNQEVFLVYKKVPFIQKDACQPDRTDTAGRKTVRVYLNSTEPANICVQLTSMGLLHPTAAAYTTFPNSDGTFIKIDHILECQVHFKNQK